jgi:glutaredoxin
MMALLMRLLVLCVVLSGGHAWANPAAQQSMLLAQAAPSKQVVMYATSWCPYCQQARNYFREQGIPYVEHDIEKDAEAKRAYQAFGGKMIPVIFVGQRQMNGFSVAGFNKIYR